MQYPFLRSQRLIVFIRTLLVVYYAMSLVRKLEVDAVEALLAENLPVCRLPATITSGLAFLTDEMWARLLSRRKELRNADVATSDGPYGSHPLDTLIPIYDSLFDFERRWTEETDIGQGAIIQNLYDPETREITKNGRHAIGASKVVAYNSVLERFLWAICNADNVSQKITVPFQINSGSVLVRPKNEKLCRFYRDGVTFWFHTIKRAMDSLLAEKTQGNPFSTPTTKTTATEKLVQAVEKCKKKSHFQALVANIADCALGIRALAAVSSVLPIRKSFR